jgi:hypothetical protein
MGVPTCPWPVPLARALSALLKTAVEIDLNILQKEKKKKERKKNDGMVRKCRGNNQNCIRNVLNSKTKEERIKTAHLN